MELPPLPDDLLDSLNSMRGGFNETIGLRFVAASYEEIVAEIPVTPALHQPYGLVHGGVYATIIETLASVGAALNAMAIGRSAVGLENSTSFLRAVRDGVLTGRATPLARGKRSQVWQVEVTDGDQRLVATGRVRMLCLEAGAAVAGETVAVKTS
ncbi:MAG: PaaI family thioesterase [Polyangiaceae bacterium]